MENYFSQSNTSYFTMLFRRGCLYLMFAILGSLDITSLHAKSRKKGNIAQKIDYNQATIAIKASSKRQAKSMLAPYKKKRTKQNAFVREQVGELFRSSTQLCVSAGLIFALHKFSNKPFELSTLVAPLIGNLAADPLKAIGRSCAMLFCPYLSQPRLNEAINLKKQYEARKHTYFVEKYAKFYRTAIE